MDLGLSWFRKPTQAKAKAGSAPAGKPLPTVAVQWVVQWMVCVLVGAVRCGSHGLAGNWQPALASSCTLVHLNTPAKERQAGRAGRSVKEKMARAFRF